MYSHNNIILVVLFIFLSSCATNSILTKEVKESLSYKKKRNIRALISKNKDNVFEEAVLEGFAPVFELVDKKPYDVIIVPEITDYKFDVLAEKCKRDKSIAGASCEGRYKVRMRVKLSVYDSDKNKIMEVTKYEEEISESFDMASGRRNNGEVARSRTQRNGAGKANSAIVNKIIPALVNKVYDNDRIYEIEELAVRRPKTAAEKKYLEGKIPFTCVLSLPPYIDDIKAKANFNRAFHINYEKQSGTTEVNIGAELKEVLLAELEKRFTEVKLLSSADGDNSMTYNPYDIQFVIDIEYRDTQVEFEPSPTVTLDASANIKTATGTTYKKIDITSQRPIKLGKGAGFLADVLGGVSITRALTEGSFIKLALENGCESAVKDAVWKIIDEFDDKFVEGFSEFSAYDSAVKSKSLSDMKHFLSIYPESKYADEVTGIMDDLMYDFAVSANLIESYVDYFNVLPNGKHRNEILNTLEHKLFSEIRNGNEQFCSTYIEFLPMGENFNEVNRICQYR